MAEMEPSGAQNALGSLLMMSGVAMSLRSFCTRIIEAHRSGTLDDDYMRAVRDEILASSENAEMTGIPLEMEAERLRQCIEITQQFIDAAIAGGAPKE